MSAAGAFLLKASFLSLEMKYASAQLDFIKPITSKVEQLLRSGSRPVKRFFLLSCS